MQQVGADESKELPIVSRANTVVKPQAVMVKTFDTLVAATTVFGRAMYPFITDDTRKDFHSFISYICIGNIFIYLFSIYRRFLLVCYCQQFYLFLLGYFTCITFGHFISKFNNDQCEGDMKHCYGNHGELRIV